MHIEEAKEEHRDWIRSLLCERWGASELVTRARLHHADQLPGFIAFQEKRPVALVTYTLQNGDCEIVSLDALQTGQGIGSAPVKAVLNVAATENCQRVWLITTNDNTPDWPRWHPHQTRDGAGDDNEVTPQQETAGAKTRWLPS